MQMVVSKGFFTAEFKHAGISRLLPWRRTSWTARGVPEFEPDLFILPME